MTVKRTSGRRSTSDKISCDYRGRATHGVRRIESRLKRKIIVLFDDGYTLGEISAKLGLSQPEVFIVIADELAREAA